MDVQLRQYGALVLGVAAMAAYSGYGPLPVGLIGADRLTLSLTVFVTAALVALLAVLTAQSVQRNKMRRLMREVTASDESPPSRQHEPFDVIASRLAASNSDLAAARFALADSSRRVDEMTAELVATEQKYQLAIRGASDGQWEWDPRSNRFLVSERWNRMLGYETLDSDLSREDWLALVHDDDREHVGSRIEAHLAGTTTRFESEHRLIASDGQVRWILSRGVAIRHANGKPWRLVGLDSDITKSKRIDEVLRHVAEGVSGSTGKAFFRKLVEHLALILGVREVFVTECIDAPPTRVRTLACWDGGQFVSDEYDLAPTPCRQVIEKGVTCFIPKGLALEFPVELPYGFESYLGIPIFDSHGKVLGHLVLIDVKEMDESIRMDSIYRIFTARAGGEMQRMMEQKSLLEMAHGLTQPTSEERLRALIRHFATFIGAKEAILAVPLDDPASRVRALVYWSSGSTATDVEYDLAGNPCEIVYGKGDRLYCPESVSVRWPLEAPLGRESYLGLPLLDVSGKVIGHLACFDDRPMPEEMPDTSALELFATRAAKEIEALGRNGRFPFP